MANTRDTSQGSSGTDTRSPTTGAPKMNPGDEAPRGTPGTGEDICPVCKGSGKISGKACENCGGSGRVIEGIGGA